MNPLTNMKNVIKLSEQDLKSNSKSSWHDQYKDSAWVFVGGLPYDLTEGDIICIFSQYGEIVNINLIRDKDTGKQKGFCFVCYEDQRSTILAVDNFNGIKILNRTIRVDHVSKYKVPKGGKSTDSETKQLYSEGCAPKAEPIVPKVKIEPQDVRETLADQIVGDIKLPLRLPIYTIKEEPQVEIKKEKKEKSKKKKKDKKKSKKKKSKDYSSSDNSSSNLDVDRKKLKKRKTDFGSNETLSQKGRHQGQHLKSTSPGISQKYKRSRSRSPSSYRTTKR